MIGPFRDKYAFLSNFHPSPFTTPKGNRCATVEHAFQAAKTDDPVEQAVVLGAGGPGLARKFGRKVTLRPDWNLKREYFMLVFVRMKFHQNPHLAQQLLDTGEERLVEVNMWNDTFWGVSNGIGDNRLGMILMRVRGELSRFEE